MFKEGYNMRRNSLNWNMNKINQAMDRLGNSWMKDDLRILQLALPRMRLQPDIVINIKRPLGIRRMDIHLAVTLDDGCRLYILFSDNGDYDTSVDGRTFYTLPDSGCPVDVLVEIVNKFVIDSLTLTDYQPVDMYLMESPPVVPIRFNPTFVKSKKRGNRNG